MKFTKMEGCGNDYVYVDCTVTALENPGEISKKVSDRHYGIGSDGLILIKKSDKADFFMEMYNSDGSQSQMCGNGIRCVGKYVYDNRLTDKTEVSIDTLAGIKYLKLNVKDGYVTDVTVDMGRPELEAKKVPVVADEEKVIAKKVNIGGTEYSMTCVSMGNPHAIVFVDSVKDIDIEKTGPLFENDSMFPERTNTEFIEIVDRKTLKMRVWERGAGETLACGTGACAALVAAVLNGYADEEASLILLGGTLHIKWDRKEDKVYMQGPATTVFTGEINL